MVKKIFSKNYRVVLILLLLLFTLLAILLLFIPRKSGLKLKEERKVSNSTALDFTLKAELVTKVEKALTIYPQEGWEKTRNLLEEVMWSCKKKSGCNEEIFFNESLDSLAKTLSNNREFTDAGRTLGIIYPGNWELADLDGDQENEVIVLQRDALNVKHIVLKIIDFQEGPRVVTYKLEGLGYFASPNSSGGGLAPIKTLDLTGDTIPEIIIFLSPGRNGAQLFVFQYQSGNLKLLLKKDNLSYPEYTFSDADNDGVLEIIVRGYNPETGGKIKEVLKK